MDIERWCEEGGNCGRPMTHRIQTPDAEGGACTFCAGNDKYNYEGVQIEFRTDLVEAVAAALDVAPPAEEPVAEPEPDPAPIVEEPDPLVNPISDA